MNDFESDEEITRVLPIETMAEAMERDKEERIAMSQRPTRNMRKLEVAA